MSPEQRTISELIDDGVCPCCGLDLTEFGDLRADAREGVAEIEAAARKDERAKLVAALEALSRSEPDPDGGWVHVEASDVDRLVKKLKAEVQRV